MTKNDVGVWRYTTPPMPPDVYSYAFEMDGAILVDRANPQPRFTHLGEGTGISTVEVPGTPPNPWDVRPVPHGSITHTIYHSGIVGDERDYYVYTPPGYDPRRTKKYPVLYLLHGLTEDASAWSTIGKANVMVDNAIAARSIKPMIIVMPTGYGITTDIGPLYDDKELQRKSLDGMSRALLEEVMPRVERDFDISSKREDHAVAGLSMGGADAMSLGLNHPDRFAYVGGFSAALVMLEPDFAAAFPGAQKAVGRPRQMIFFGVGDMEGPLFEGAKLVKSALDRVGIPSELQIYPGRVHNWANFRRQFAVFLEHVFS